MSSYKRILAGLIVAAGVTAASPCPADLPYMWATRYRAPNYSWKTNYAHIQYGQPVAAPLPPTVRLQTNYRWGVGSSRISRVDHQFGRNYPGAGPIGGP
ncbi:MAG: hypothetical protein KDA37_15730, partial [Planctomycetales bacterium]|nr:hypothetical protein [Planctomycetales bacterium]